MDSNEPSDSNHLKSESSDLAIDHINGVSTVSTDSIVKRFVASSILLPGALAELPPESNDSICETCGRPEAEGCVVVCDGCELGFHVDCLGMMEGDAIELEDWICGKCSGSNRWKLGKKNKRRRLDADSALDFDGSRRTEEGGERGDNPFGGNLFDIPGEATNLHQFSNNLGSHKASDTAEVQVVQPSLELIDSCLEGLTGENSTDKRSSTKDQSETYLQALEDYLKDKHIVLVEGWHVEFEQCSATRELRPVYVAPDGKRLMSVSEVASYLKSITTNMPAKRGTGKYDDGLPLQYGDFFVLSVGEVDARHSYHCRDQIWPVGYSSCWHDKVTGSLFTCDVLDNGDSGPLFKVKRSPCSAFPIPNALQVLYQAKHDHSNSQNKISGVLASQSMDNEESSVLSLLAEPPSPLETDVLSCLGHSSDDYLGMHGSHIMLTEKSPLCEIDPSSLSNCSPFGHDADTFSVEESSSALAWSAMSIMILNVFRERYTLTGALKFFCNHVVDQPKLFCCAAANKEAVEKSDLLTRFYGLPMATNIPYIIQDDMKFEIVAQELLKWLDQDRFGLNAEFVQEIIEQRQDVRNSLSYVPLNQRSSFSSFITVGSSLLESKVVEFESEDVRCQSDCLASFSKVNSGRIEQHLSDTGSLPTGRNFSTKMPSLLLGDAIQVLEFFWRFHEVLGLKEPLKFEDIEEELINTRCHGVDLLEKVGREIHGNSRYRSVPEVDVENACAFVQMERKPEETSPLKLEEINSGKYSGSALTKAAISMLQVLISELQTKAASVANQNSDIGDTKKRGRKKDLGSASIAKINKLSMLPCNELTWPELSRRYALALLLENGYFDSTNITTHDSIQVFRCLQGDGGALCGSLTGVSGIEADALLLAEASKRIFGSLDAEKDKLVVDDEDFDRECLDDCITSNESIPDWIQALEPVRKLPTNVGARIKKCIYNALERGPPEWAIKILERSLSKEVYKGNASGPTKRAVLSVLKQAHGENVLHEPVNEKKKKFISISDVLMKQCQLVLRQSIAADHGKVFCNLLGKRVTDYNSDEGVIGAPGMVSRPLDFRTIDQRLAVNAYGGNHKAFYEDACKLGKVWNDVFIAFKHQPDLLQVAENLADNFYSLYDKEIATLSQKLLNCSKLKSVDASLQKEIKEILARGEIPKAPWENGICKVCGIDNDDKSVLLCDSCDAEYHTYCLNPPLARIPSGNWYCPSCVTDKKMVSDAYNETALVCQQQKKYHGKLTHAYIGMVAHLADVMAKKEYWELSPAGRTVLFKFLCDELLNSTLLHRHLECSAEDSVELNQRLRSVLKDMKALKLREKFLATKVDDGSLMASQYDVEVQESDGTSTGNEKSSGYLDTLSDSGNHISASDDVQKSVDPNVFVKQLLDDCLENSDSVDCQSFEPMDVDDAERNLNVSNSEDLDEHHASVDKCATNLNNHPLTTNTSSTKALNPGLKSLRNEILHLNSSITSLHTKLQKVSLRSEFLGVDSGGRLYWVVSKSDGRPLIVINENVELQHSKDKSHTPSGSNVSPPFWCEPFDSCSAHSSWTSYGSDSEIKMVLEFLKDDDPLERKLKESISHWKKQRDDIPQLPGISSPHEVLDANLATRASSLLEARYGSSIDVESTEFFKKQVKGGNEFVRDGIYRCKCLEPIISLKHHCIYCHRTLFAEGELRFHGQGKCVPSLGGPEQCAEVNSSSKLKDMVKSKTAQYECKGEFGSADQPGSEYPKVNSCMAQYQTDASYCPFDLDSICSKFVIEDSMKDIAAQIGLLGSKEIPTFVPSLPPYLSDPASALFNVQDKNADAIASFEKCAMKPTMHDSSSSQASPSRNDSKLCDKLKHDTPPGNCLEHKETVLHHDSRVEVGNSCLVPESALKPLVGDTSHVLRHLKINLLDMDAALPEEALRPSKSQKESRWAWRAFVKSAETIYQMVQALIVFEEAIKSEYLSNMWYYWSSISGAAKISTLSSLALRIYALDAAIEYEKVAVKKTKPGRKPSKKGKEL